MLKKVSTPLFVSVFSAQTARESINIVYKSLTIGLIDLNAALHPRGGTQL